MPALLILGDTLGVLVLLVLDLRGDTLGDILGDALGLDAGDAETEIVPPIFPCTLHP